MQTLAQVVALDDAALRRLLDDIPVGIGIAEPVEPDGTIEPDARIVYYNKHWVRMFGFDASEVRTVEEATRRLYPDPELLEERLRSRAEAAARRRFGGGEQTEARAMGAGGDWLTVLTGTTVVGDRLVVTMLDITAQKRAARELAGARQQLEKVAYEVTENIPAGTYTMVQPADGGMARFSFLSTRFLEICGVSREAAEQDSLNVFACVHPDDYDEWMRKNVYVFEHMLPFSEECRIVVRGEVRWIHAASNPRRLPDGSTVWEGVLTDITERKLAEEQLAKSDQLLRQSEQRYRNFFTLPLVGTAITSRTKGWIEVNDRTCEILGYPREELFGKTWADLTHPEDLAADEAQFARMLRREIDGYQIEKRFIRKDGSVVYTLLAGGCGPVGDEIPDVFYVNILDITERKQAEIKLRDALMNLPLPVACGSNDEPPAITLVNKAFTRTFGYTHEDIPTVQDWTEAAYPDAAYRAEVLARWEKSLSLGHGAPGADIDRDVRIRCKDGSMRDAIFSTTLTPDGPIVAFLDITERKKAETILAAANARMHLAARAAHLGFWHFHVAEDREEWDENLHAMYGSKPGKVSPRWETFLHPEDRTKAMKLMRSALEQGGPYEMEFRIVRPDGGVRHIRECGIVVLDKNGNAVTATGADIDITEQTIAGQRERQAEQTHRAELERKLKTSLSASVVAHEVNQPLSAILLDSQMALKRLKGDSRELEQARAFLSSTISNAERAVDTIGKVSTLLRSVPTSLHEVNLVDVVRSAALYAKDDLRTAGIDLFVESPGRAVKVQGDEGQLLLAVSNLLRNAIEVIQTQDKGRARKIVLTVRRSKGSVILSVADSGPGLPRKTLTKIPLNTTKPQGTGLGLFIVKAVAENHGAKLEARRSQLGGAEVRLVFPAARK